MFFGGSLVFRHFTVLLLRPSLRTIVKQFLNAAQVKRKTFCSQHNEPLQRIYGGIFRFRPIFVSHTSVIIIYLCLCVLFLQAILPFAHSFGRRRQCSAIHFHPLRWMRTVCVFCAVLGIQYSHCIFPVYSSMLHTLYVLCYALFFPC